MADEVGRAFFLRSFRASDFLRLRRTLSAVALPCPFGFVPPPAFPAVGELFDWDFEWEFEEVLAPSWPGARMATDVPA